MRLTFNSPCLPESRNRNRNNLKMPKNVWANLENKLQKRGECTIKYWACQSPKTRHPRHSRSKYYILMMTSSAKLRDKKSPYRPINRRILINKMMKHNLIIIEGFFFIEDTSWSLKKYFFYNAWLASCPFLRKKNSFGVVKKWGEENIR